MSILQLENITYRYESSDHNVLESINVHFDQGKVYAIVGKSGAGKSTLLSLIAGLELPTSGDLSYEDKNIRNLDRNQYRSQSIGVIFQSFNLLTNATALENIMLSMHISKVKHPDIKAEALRLLERVGIDETTAKRKILKLSGGEQQRVGIARALAHDPKIIIADEPTGNLDSDNEDVIMKLLTEAAYDENRCVIIVTHSKKLANKTDEIWGLNGGKLSFVRAQEQQ